MNQEKAYDILEIDRNTRYLSLADLRKKYHKQALKYHPDKNGNNLESTEKFQQINEAFHFIKEQSKFSNHEDNDHEDDNQKSSENLSSEKNKYTEILVSFLSSIVDGKYREILKKIILNVKNTLTLDLLNDLDKEACMNVYVFLTKYSSVFHLSSEFLGRVREKVLKKYEDTTLYILNPSVDDLMRNNFYKLVDNEKTYYVPLWHNESYFDNNIIVLCEPSLPKGYYIDESNDLIVDLKYDLKEILNLETLEVKIGSCTTKQVFVSDLYIRKNQLYRLRGCGISKVNENDVYDVSERSDILLNIEIDFGLEAKYL